MKTILVTAQKGGVGKSTLSFLLAKKYSEENFKTGVIDLDNQGSFLKIKDLILENNKFDIFSWKEVTDNPDITDELDYLIIDCPPYNMAKLKELVDLSDFVIVPTKLEELSVTSVNDTLEKLESIGAKDKCLIVPNMLNQFTNYSEIYDYIEGTGFKKIENGILNYAALSRIVISNADYTGNCKLKTDASLIEIMNFIN